MPLLESVLQIWFFTTGLLLITLLYNRLANQPTSFPRTLLQLKRVSVHTFKAI